MRNHAIKLGSTFISTLTVLSSIPPLRIPRSQNMITNYTCCCVPNMNRRFIHCGYLSDSFTLSKRFSVKNTVTYYFNTVLSKTYSQESKTIDSENSPKVPLSVIRKFLKQHEIKVTESYTCLITDCISCTNKGNDPKVLGKLYVNKTTGYFICHNCHYSGPWSLLVKLLEAHKTKQSLSPRDNEKLRKSTAVFDKCKEEWNNIYKTTIALHMLNEQEFKVFLNHWNFQNIPQSALKQLGIRCDIGKKMLYIPLLNAEAKIVGYKTISTVEVYTVPQSDSEGFICSRSVKSCKQETAVVVPNLVDALLLIVQRIPHQIFCLPYGLSHLPQQSLPVLENYKKLILWFGNEYGAWDAARNFAKKLDEKRCFFVRPIEKHSSPSEAIAYGQDIKSILCAAQPAWHQAITTFATLREDVLSELQNLDKVQGVKWKRFPVLNRILRGHRNGELTVFTGPTGSGKTTFMSEYSLDLAMQGVNTLWGSFEIRNARLARTMLQQMAEVPLDENLQRFDEFADAFERLPLYFMTFHGQQSLKVVMEAVEHAAYVHDIAHVIIDNVQFMMGMSEEPRHIDRFWKQDAIIAYFRTFATKRNCHVTLVIHPRKERDIEELTINSIFGSAKAAQEADNVLIIQDKRLTALRGKKFLQIAKNRYTGDLGIMPLEFDKDRLSYSFKKKKISELEVEH